MLIDNWICKWKARLILSEVEGSGPSLSRADSFALAKADTQGQPHGLCLGFLGTRFRRCDGKVRKRVR
jgi:hypothetical protein